MNDDALDRLLKDRHIPDCDADFLDTIKSQARLVPQRISLWAELKQVWYSSLHLKPGYALGMMVVIGFLAGFGLSLLQTESPQTALAEHQATHLTVYQQGYQL